jgi:hypothetical protein
MGKFFCHLDALLITTGSLKTIFALQFRVSTRRFSQPSALVAMLTAM